MAGVPPPGLADRVVISWGERGREGGGALGERRGGEGPYCCIV